MAFRSWSALLILFAEISIVHAAPPNKAVTEGISKPAGSPLLRTLSLHDRIAQLFVVRGYGDYPASDNAEYKRFERWIREDHVGGFIVAGRIRNRTVIAANPFEMAVFINHVQHLARTPLLVASDFERGASMRVSETAKFPYMMAFGAARDLDATRRLGVATAREARALGVNWVFAPDADVNNNPGNPIINVRSFGEDPQEVAANVGAFIDGAHSDARNYVLVSAKHFPGHGDTAQDSHMLLPKIEQPRERIESMELVPFRAAIQHGADSIMTAHLAVPAIEPTELPATLSHNVLTGLLRDELGYKGLIVTDALEMQAVASLFTQGEAAVRAIEAGADVLLMPVDPEPCIKAIEAAVKSGRLTRRRIDLSVSKILAAKQRAGLYRNRFVSVDAIADHLEEKEADDLAERVANQSLTLVKDTRHLFPMPASTEPCLVLLSESEFSQHGASLLRELQKKSPSLKNYVVNPMTSETVLSAVATDTHACKQIYVAAFVAVQANRGSVALEGGLTPFLNALIHGPAPVALIAFGNPYLLRDFAEVSSYLATFSTADSSEYAAGRAILGQIPVRGKLPVSIPPLAKVGDGLSVAASASAASNGGQ